MPRRKIGVLHPGEMGVALARTARNTGHEVLWVSDGRSAITRRRATEAGLQDAGTFNALCATSELIVSICPPEFAESMARDVAAQRFKGMYVDANAISPARACRIAALMACHEIVYVDGCVIGLPAAERGETWIYLSGPEAREAASCFSGGPLEVEVLGPEISRASALKMCFAAHTKGIAALRAAVLGTARQLGVLDDLDRQWSRSGPPFAKAVESIQHTAPKAWRFVAEMKEIAATFESAGLPPGFHLAAAAIFDRLASFKGSKPDLEEALQRLVSGGLPADSLYPEKDLKT